jgi:hypothetical protein
MIYVHGDLASNLPIRLPVSCSVGTARMKVHKSRQTRENLVSNLAENTPETPLSC